MQMRRRKEQIAKNLQTLSSHLNQISLKMTKRQFASLTSPAHHFDVVANEPAPENECISESDAAAINYLMLKHEVLICFFIMY